MSRILMAALVSTLSSLITLVSLVVAPSPAHADARVSISNEFGTAAADPTYATTLSIRGTGFQSIKNGHGGVYVFFGTVKSGWRPSQGGITGQDYLYVPDSEAKNNQGFQQYIAFPGSDTASSAQGVMSANGAWTARIKVPGASFQAVDRDGKATTVNCLKVTCGVITIGAHGVKNARNETFTPVSFKDLYDGSSATATPTDGSTASADPTGQASGQATESTGTATKIKGKATASIDTDTAMVGRVLSFSGHKFWVGEQVTASFDNGLAAVGPLTAGSSGEVAGVLQLPASIKAGTHTLRLTGAASGKTVDLNFPVKADDQAAVVAVAAEGRDGLPDWAAWVFLGAASVALVAATVFSVVRLRRRSA